MQTITQKVATTMIVDALSEFGVTTGSDEQHAWLADAAEFDQQEFFTAANELLEEISPAVVGEVVPRLEAYSGRWNPVGFLVFPLGLHETLGSLRLHVWPSGMRKSSAHGPNIHYHAWHLASKVLAGTYQDTIYDINEPTLSEADQALFLYELKSRAKGWDVMGTDGSKVIARPVQKRRVEEGEIHTIEAGYFHLPKIPLSELVATLVIDSPAFSDNTGVLIDGSGGEISRQRKQADTYAVNTAKTQFQEYRMQDRAA